SEIQVNIDRRNLEKRGIFIVDSTGRMKVFLEKASAEQIAESALNNPARDGSGRITENVFFLVERADLSYALVVDFNTTPIPIDDPDYFEKYKAEFDSSLTDVEVIQRAHQKAHRIIRADRSLARKPVSVFRTIFQGSLSREDTSANRITHRHIQSIYGISYGEGCVVGDIADLERHFLMWDTYLKTYNGPKRYNIRISPDVTIVYRGNEEELHYLLRDVDIRGKGTLEIGEGVLIQGGSIELQGDLVIPNRTKIIDSNLKGKLKFHGEAGVVMGVDFEPGRLLEIDSESPVETLDVYGDETLVRIDYQDGKKYLVRMINSMPYKLDKEKLKTGEEIIKNRIYQLVGGYAKWDTIRRRMQIAESDFEKVIDMPLSSICENEWEWFVLAMLIFSEGISNEILYDVRDAIVDILNNPKISLKDEAIANVIYSIPSVRLSKIDRMVLSREASFILTSIENRNISGEELMDLIRDVYFKCFTAQIREALETVTYGKVKDLSYGEALFKVLAAMHPRLLDVEGVSTWDKVRDKDFMFLRHYGGLRDAKQAKSEMETLRMQEMVSRARNGSLKSNAIILGQDISKAWEVVVRRGLIRNRTIHPDTGEEIECGLEVKPDGKIGFYGRMVATGALIDEPVRERLVDNTLVRLIGFRRLKPTRSKRMEDFPPHDYSKCSFCSGLLSLVARKPLGVVNLNNRIWEIHYNISPIEPEGHFLLIPTLLAPFIHTNRRAQHLNKEDLDDFMTLSSVSDNMAFWYNSPRAGASQNHIHIQASIKREPCNIETKPIEWVSDVEGVRVGRVLSYDATAVVLEGSQEEVNQKLWPLINLLQTEKIPFNIYLPCAGGRVYLFIRNKEAEITEEFPDIKIGIGELVYPFMLETKEAFDEITAEKIASARRKTTLPWEKAQEFLIQAGLISEEELIPVGGAIAKHKGLSPLEIVDLFDTASKKDLPAEESIFIKQRVVEILKQSGIQDFNGIPKSKIIDMIFKVDIALVSSPAGRFVIDEDNYAVARSIKDRSRLEIYDEFYQFLVTSCKDSGDFHAVAGLFIHEILEMEGKTCAIAEAMEQIICGSKLNEMIEAFSRGVTTRPLEEGEWEQLGHLVRERHHDIRPSEAQRALEEAIRDTLIYLLETPSAEAVSKMEEFTAKVKSTDDVFGLIKELERTGQLSKVFPWLPLLKEVTPTAETWKGMSTYEHIILLCETIQHIADADYAWFSQRGEDGHIDISYIRRLKVIYDELSKDPETKALLWLVIISHDIGKMLDLSSAHDIKSKPIIPPFIKPFGLRQEMQDLTQAAALLHTIKGDIAITVQTPEYARRQLEMLVPDRKNTGLLDKILTLLTVADVNSVGPDGMLRDDKLASYLSPLAEYDVTDFCFKRLQELGGRNRFSEILASYKRIIPNGEKPQFIENFGRTLGSIREWGFHLYLNPDNTIRLFRLMAQLAELAKTGRIDGINANDLYEFRFEDKNIKKLQLLSSYFDVNKDFFDNLTLEQLAKLHREGKIEIDGLVIRFEGSSMTFNLDNLTLHKVVLLRSIGASPFKGRLAFLNWPVRILLFEQILIHEGLHYLLAKRFGRETTGLIVKTEELGIGIKYRSPTDIRDELIKITPAIINILLGIIALILFLISPDKSTYLPIISLAISSRALYMGLIEFTRNGELRRGVDNEPTSQIRPYRQYSARSVLEPLDLKTDDVYLDLACGPGTYTIVASMNGAWETVSIDVSRNNLSTVETLLKNLSNFTEEEIQQLQNIPMVDILSLINAVKARGKKEGEIPGNAIIRKGSAAYIPLESDSVDKLSFTEPLELLGNRKKQDEALKEMLRVTNAGGLIHIAQETMKLDELRVRFSLIADKMKIKLEFKETQLNASTSGLLIRVVEKSSLLTQAKKSLKGLTQSLYSMGSRLTAHSTKLFYTIMPAERDVANSSNPFRLALIFLSTLSKNILKYFKTPATMPTATTTLRNAWRFIINKKTPILLFSLAVFSVIYFINEINPSSIGLDLLAYWIAPHAILNDIPLDDNLNILRLGVKLLHLNVPIDTSFHELTWNLIVKEGGHWANMLVGLFGRETLSPIVAMPINHFIFMPFTLLGFSEMVVVWGLINVILTFSSTMLLVFKLSQNVSLKRKIFYSICLSSIAMFLFGPSVNNFKLGQINVPILTLTTMGVLLYNSKNSIPKSVLASLFLSLATAMKLYPGVVLGFLVLRTFIFIFSSVIDSYKDRKINIKGLAKEQRYNLIFLIVSGISLAIFMFGPFIALGIDISHWMELSSGMLNQFNFERLAFGLAPQAFLPFVGNLFAGLGMKLPLIVENILQKVIIIFVGLFTMKLAYRESINKSSISYTAVGTIVALGLLMMPHLWNHYAVILIIPAIIIIFNVNKIKSKPIKILAYSLFVLSMVFFSDYNILYNFLGGLDGPTRFYLGQYLLNTTVIPTLLMFLSVYIVHRFSEPAPDATPQDIAPTQPIEVSEAPTAEPTPTPTPAGAMPLLKTMFINRGISETTYNLKIAPWLENIISFIGGAVFGIALYIITGDLTLSLNASYLLTWLL
ncbi:MAG: DUF2029 domain-containing protein, partial [Candidatus Omnitrophica bacterium]|nr:DUF2029 domain-containing protein [Candidatus Omnitrophota bacterium]